MSKRSIITAGLLAATAVGAGVAQAAPTVTSVEANRTGRGRLEIVVEAARGTATTPPVITATINGRTRTARALGWAKATQPTDTVTYSAKFQRGRLNIGPSVNVTIKACDAPGVGCTETPYTLTVVKSTPAASRIGKHSANTPLPAGAVDATQATSIALASVGAGSTLIEIERADELGAAWEVKVLRADGARVKVYVAADGTIVATRVEGVRAGKDGDDDHAPATPPAGSITSDQAIAIALAQAGDGATLRQFEFSNEHGGQFEVKVVKADGTRVEVKIGLDGTVLKVEVDR